MNVRQARRAIEQGRDEHRRTCRAPLPAGVSEAEGALQEQLFRRGHPFPLSAAARRVDAEQAQRQPASLLCALLPPEQWSAGTRRPGHAHDDSVTNKLRAWLWAHTAQPNGDPWDADPDELDRAAADLAATLAGGN